MTAVLTRTGLERFRLANTEFVPALTPRDSSASCFRIHKSAEAIAGFPRLRPLLRFRNVLQVTGEDVGSAALTSLVGSPAKLVVVSTVGASIVALTEFAERRGITDHLRIYTNVDAGDREQLVDIIDEEFGPEGVEVVLDESSEGLDAGWRTFECLFPTLGVGGTHVIERWGWDHFFIEGFLAALDPSAADIEAARADAVERTSADRGPVLEQILPMLVERMAVRPDVISAVTASKHWLAVRRGDGEARSVGL